MLLRLTLYLPDAPAKTRVLHRCGEWVLGRASECDVQIDHVSVSRRHAQLFDDGTQVRIADLGSKNGTRLQGRPVGHADLPADAWFSVGDVFCQLESLELSEVDQQQKRAADRQTRSNTLAQRLQASTDEQDLVTELLKGFVELSECRRGFLLLGPDAEQLHVRACYGISPDDLNHDRFAGSRSAVARALRERRAVYMDARHEQAWLAAQASVVAGGLRSVVCLPLVNEGDLLGAIYADTDDTSRVFTDLDAELMTALVDQATSTLVAQQIEQRLRQMESWLQVEPGRTHWKSSAQPWIGKPA